MADEVESTGLWKLIDSRMTVLRGFYNQVDQTRKRLNLTPYQLTDFDKKTKLDDVINVTENRAATYTARIIAGLMSSKWQTVIEGDITQRNSYKIEQFIDANLDQGDETMLDQTGLAGLNSWINNHVCHTSLIGVQWMCFIEDEEYKTHCLPVDMRWTPFVMNKWAAPITFRSGDDLLEELEGYEKAAKDGGDEYFYTTPPKLQKTNNEVRDYWNEEKNELWVSKQLVFRQPNIYGKLPFVFVWPPSGFMFRDKDYLDHESPPITFLNELLYDQLSRQMSVDATLGFETVLPAYEYGTENPSGDVSRAPPKRGESLEVPAGEEHKLLPRGDVNNAQLTSRAEVSKMVDEAAPMAPRAYTQPPSAVEVALEVELLDVLQFPRVRALEVFKEQLARLIIDQFMIIGGEGSPTIQAGKRGKKSSFSVADLKDPDKYTISYKMLRQNKRLAIVNESRYLALSGRAPLKYLLTDVLTVDDPDGWMREMELEAAEKADPALALFSMAVRYAEEAADIDDETDADLLKFQSMMLVDRGVAMVKERMQPAQLPQEAQTPIPEKTTGNANPLMSMMGPQKDGIISQPKGAANA